MDDNLSPDPELLLKLAKMRMPFGKYKDQLLIDLPEPYVIWFSQKGFPEGHNLLKVIFYLRYMISFIQ